MEYPKISIVTPSYNQSAFLEQTIRSVVEQEYPNLEYIVIDGGSTDGSVDVIKKYADKITYWVSEKDKGQYDAINKGFSHTTGGIMGWINSSDILYPWTLKLVAEIFEHNKEVQWIHGLPSNMDFGNAPQSIYYANEKNVYDIIGGNYKGIQQESVFWRRGLWEKAGNQLDLSIRYGGDFNLWLQFYKYENLYYVNTLLGGFRFHDIRIGGYDVETPYGKEVRELFEGYRAKASGAHKFRAFLIKTLVGKSRTRSKIIARSGLFSWYKRYSIAYDFGTCKWIAKKS